MSVASLESNIVNFAKKVKGGLEAAGEDALKVATFLSTNSTEITGLASLAGPTGTAVAGVSTAVLGQVINAVKAAGDAGSANGLSVTLDASVIADVKAVITAIEKI
jgi:hypothetical protein